MARDRAGPRLSIFRSKRMRGWWPLIRLKSQEDIDKELKEEEEAKKKGKKKKKSKRDKMKKEDIEFTDSSGNTYLLMVRGTNHTPGSNQLVDLRSPVEADRSATAGVRVL